MSLINQMLQDLEKRESEPGSGGELPAGVHSAANTLPASRRWLWMLAAGLAAIAGVLLLPAKKTAAPPAPPPVAAALLPAEPVPVSVPETTPPVALPQETTKAEPTNRAPVAPKAHPAPERKRQPASQPKPAAIPPAPAHQKAGGVAKTAPLNEAQARAEQNYRNALNAYGQGRASESMALARQVLVDDPGHHSARQLLLKQMLEHGEREPARALLREGLRQDSGQVSWSLLLARLELERGDLAAARLAVDQAAPQAANHADFQSLAGAIAQRQGRPDDSAEFYRNALRLKPADGRAWVGLAIALEAQGHQPEAREAFRRALDTEGLSPELQALAQRKQR